MRLYDFLACRVGCNNCSVNIIVKTLRDDAATYSLLCKNWILLARDLNINEVLIVKFQQDMILEKIGFNDIIYEVLQAWVCKEGKHAVLINFIQSLDSIGYKDCADALRGYFCETVPQNQRRIGSLSDRHNSASNLSSRENFYLHSACAGQSDIDMCFAILTHFFQLYLPNRTQQLYLKNNNGLTFLHILVKKDELSPKHLHELSKLLVKKKIVELFNVTCDTKNSTPFQWTLESLEPMKESLNLLHANGVDFEVIDRDGYSSLAYAVRGGRSANLIVHLIEHFKADWKCTVQNRDLLDIACGGGNLEAVKLFTDKARGYCLDANLL